MPAASTIGYEGSNIDSFIHELLRSGVSVLVDVRQVAISRKKGFSKTALSEKLESVGIRYVHLRGLGDPKPGRIAAREGRHSDFVRIYTQHLRTDDAQNDFERASQLCVSEHACLLCFEREANGCHRKIISDAISCITDVEFTHLKVGAEDAQPPAKRGRGRSTDIGQSAAACQ